MKNFIIICCVLVANFGQIRSMAITHSSCPKTSSDHPKLNYTRKPENISEILGHYFGCVYSPSTPVPTESKECIRLNVKPHGQSGWELHLTALPKKTGEQKNESVKKSWNSPLVSYIPLDLHSKYIIYFGCTENQEDWWIEYYARTLELCSEYRYKLDEKMQKYNLTSIPLVNLSHKNCD
ncbi:uncharacterized protein LOC123270342 [Cotesia glomerata]|uniref:Salivary lipocalin n=1 Tax=Cotesia glomerata TaxID=32391 RepID=A0AAV7IJU4_COTGL|nr:uncharacterized protein LOC123270342 [Cotesia glomerata]KAH0552000.1 hypothetical protein KQX54_004045 [Cotesia glomerata]